MRYDLKAIVRRTRNPRRREIVFRPIVAPAILAGDLYAAGYRPIVDVWTAAAPAIVAEYDRTLGELTQDAPADISAVISAVEGDVARLMLTIRLRLERWALRVEGYQRGKWRSAVLTATGVDLETLIGPADARMTMAAAIERNVALVRSVSDQTRDRISDEVFSGLRERKPAREVAKAISEKVGMGRRRALLIASDQTSKLAAQLNVERALEAGLEHYEWISSGKVHYRPEHKARNGKRYEYGKPEGDEPGFAIHCGCTARAVLSLDDEF